MKRLLILVVLSGYACASTTYYVSSSAGSDSNSGTSAAAAWKTLAKVNLSALAAGDRVLLARGDVWREPLIPPSHGASGNPIVFDAYGSGAAPEITGYQALSGWMSAGTNQWKAAVVASTVNYVLFGTIWGTKQSSQSALLHDRDFYFSGNTLYVYAASDPSLYYGTVSAMVLTNAPIISVNTKSWLTFQHLKLDWFDQYGVSVTGGSDHLVFANMEADGTIPAGSFPVGFYVNASNPGDVNFYNDSAHLNFDGFRVDGTASAINLTNCSAYANRDTGVTDNTGGHVTYSYSHFYANGIGGIESLDVVGAVAGTGNVPAGTPPNVQAFARYPARFSFTVDDVGLFAGSDAFVDALIPVFNARGLKINAAVVAGTTGVSYSTLDVASWVAGGHEVDSHSWSHQYFTDPQYLTTNHIYNSTSPTPATAFSLRYVGTGTAATVTVSGSGLTTEVSGAPAEQKLNLNFSTPPYDTLGGLSSFISSNYPGVYTVTTWTTPLMRVAAHSSALASVSAQDIKTAAYGLQFDPTRAATGLMADEALQSRNLLQSRIAGLSNVKVYVYPDGVTDPAFEAAVAAAGYEGARGTLSMCVSGAAPCAGTNAFVSYATGVNAQNIMSLTPLGWTNYSTLTQTQLDAKVTELIFKMRVWGYPVGLFVHANDYPDSGTAALKTGWLLDSIAARGGTVSRTDALIETVLGMQPISGTSKYVSAASGPALNFAPTPGAAGIGRGANLGAGYAIDLAGASRPASGPWDVGAYEILWTKHGRGSASGHFTMGVSAGAGTGENAYCLAGDVAVFGSSDGSATLPQQCTYTAMAGTPSPGTVRTATSCSDIATKLAAISNNSGDVLVIPASLGTCVGYWTPTYQGDAGHWLTIRTDQIATTGFPAEGVQANPCQIGVTQIDGYPDYSCASPSTLMPTLSSGTTNKSTLDLSGCNYCRVIGLNITKQSGTSMVNSLVNMAGDDHVILDRVLIHGMDWSAATKLDTKTGVTTKGTHQAIINSWIYDIDYNSADGQCLAGGTGAQLDEGPLKVYNNLLACSSQTWLFGGGGAAAWPHDFEIRRNLSMKPLKWMAAIGTSTFSGPNQTWPNVKNLGEFKHGHRILYEENIFMNSWEGQSDQTGNVILTMPKNQSQQNTSKYVNTNGTAVTCASDATGTPCAAHTGLWGNRITNISRTAGQVALTGLQDGGWPYYGAGGKIVIQGIVSQVVNGVDLASFNGEWTMDPGTSGYGATAPYYIYFTTTPAGPDIPSTAISGFAQDYTASTCAIPGHCVFAAPMANYPSNPIAAVIDSEHITVTQDLGVQTGATQATCRPGAAPNAQVQDFTVRYNYLQHAENIGFTMANAVSNCLDVTMGVSNISYHDNVHDDIDTTAWNRSAGSCCGHGGAGLTIANSVPDISKQTRNVEIAHNTFASQRGWPGVYHASGSFGFSDGYNYSFTGQTLQRVNNLVTTTYTAIAGEAGASTIIVAGFTGSYADLNGTWPVFQQLGTSMSFIESGSHADINPAITISSGTTGVGTLTPPLSYYANVKFRDNIGPGPVYYEKWNSSNDSRGLSAMLDLNMKDPSSGISTWTYKNNLLGTALYSGYTQASTANFPVTNPDGSSACTLPSCAVTDFSGVFTNWGSGVGDTSNNDYTVTATYKNAASDGRDMGADSSRWKALRAALMPHFTFTPLTAAASQTMTCTNGTYCEQQLTWSGGASPFVQWHWLTGSLPTGMGFANGDGAVSCKVNGSYSKTGATGCAGWIYGTPTQTGTFTLTFQVEDAAHQKASVTLTLTVQATSGPPAYPSARFDLNVTQPDATPLTYKLQ